MHSHNIKFKAEKTFLNFFNALSKLNFTKTESEALMHANGNEEIDVIVEVSE